MSLKHSGKQPPFVAVYRLTMKSDAWRALSVGAKATFLELRKNYNTKAQNAVFLSARDGARELGVHRDTVCKWVHELEHYGFIVEVRGAHLGVTGTGKAAHYRLTDSPHGGIPPTYDFQNWDGVLYDPKKQNPVRKIRTPRPKKPDTQPIESASNGNKRPIEPAIRNVEECPNKPAITSLTTPSGIAAPIPPDPVLPLSSKPKLVWSTPTLTEVEYTEELRRLYADAMLSASPYLAKQVQKRWGHFRTGEE